MSTSHGPPAPGQNSCTVHGLHCASRCARSVKVRLEARGLLGGLLDCTLIAPATDRGEPSVRNTPAPGLRDAQSISRAVSRLPRGLVEQPRYPIAGDLEISPVVHGSDLYIRNPDRTEDPYEPFTRSRESWCPIETAEVVARLRIPRDLAASVGPPPQWCPAPATVAPRPPDRRSRPPGFFEKNRTRCKALASFLMMVHHHLFRGDSPEGTTRSQEVHGTIHIDTWFSTILAHSRKHITYNYLWICPPPPWVGSGVFASCKVRASILLSSREARPLIRSSTDRGSLPAYSAINLFLRAHPYT